MYVGTAAKTLRYGLRSPQNTQLREFPRYLYIIAITTARK